MRKGRSSWKGTHLNAAAAAQACPHPRHDRLTWNRLGRPLQLHSGPGRTPNSPFSFVRINLISFFTSPSSPLPPLRLVCFLLPSQPTPLDHSRSLPYFDLPDPRASSQRHHTITTFDSSDCCYPRPNPPCRYPPSWLWLVYKRSNKDFRVFSKYSLRNRGNIHVDIHHHSSPPSND